MPIGVQREVVSRLGAIDAVAKAIASRRIVIKGLASRLIERTVLGGR